MFNPKQEDQREELYLFIVTSLFTIHPCFEKETAKKLSNVFFLQIWNAVHASQKVMVKVQENCKDARKLSTPEENNERVIIYLCLCKFNAYGLSRNVKLSYFITLFNCIEHTLLSKFNKNS